MLPDHRFPVVLADDNLLVFQNNTQKLRFQKLTDIRNIEHVAVTHHLSAVTVDQQIDPGHLFPVQKLDYTVRIVNRRNLRRCDHNNAVGIRRRQLKTAVNSRRTVNQNVIKFFSQVRQQIFHLFFIQIVFGVTGARRRYDPEIRIPLVPDQRLLNAASPGQDVDQIIEDPVFQSHDYIEVP